MLTGATGVLGRRVLPALLQAGHAVRVVSRSPLPEGLVPIEYADKAEVLTGELHDPTVLHEAARGIDACVHIAGKVSFSAESKQRLMYVNKEGTAAVADALLEVAPTAHLVHLSSVAAYPRDRANESLVTAPSHFTGWYGFSKYQSELEVHRAAAEGLGYTIFRPSVILDSHPEGRSSASLVKMALRRRTITPPGYINFIGVQDVVDAILAAITCGAENHTYTLDAGPARWETLFTALRRAAHIKGGMYALPDSAWPAFSRLLPFARLFYSGPPPIRRQILNLLNENTYPGRREAEALIGHPLTPLDALIPSLIAV